MTMPTGDLLPLWHQMYANDFSSDAAVGTIGNSTYRNQTFLNGNSINALAMKGQDGYTDTSGNGLYKPDSVLSVHDSMLDVYLHYDASVTYNGQTGWPLVGCPVPMGFTGWAYGRYDARFKISNWMPGYKIAFLEWPNSNLWKDGEIDWAETDDLSSGSTPRPASTIVGSYDVNGSNPSWDAGGGTHAQVDLTQWNVCSTRWSPGLIEWYMNDVKIGSTQTPSGVPVKGMIWKLQCETKISGSPPDPAVSGHVLIDWVTAYQRIPGPRFKDVAGQHLRRVA